MLWPANEAFMGHLSILNLNCWLLPPPLSIKNSERLHELIIFIKEHEPDIVTLQEVWLQSYVRRLRKELSLYSVIPSSPGIFNRSGLVTLTKTTPLQVRQNTFPTKKGYSMLEKLIRKGFQEIILQHGEETILLVNSHLYTPEKSNEKNIPIFQFKDLIQRYTDKKNVILIGDFNMTKNNILKLNTTFQLIECFDTIQLPKNCYQRSRFNKQFIYGDNVDHCLINNASFTCDQFQLVGTPIVSDHFIMILACKSSITN